MILLLTTEMKRRGEGGSYPQQRRAHRRERACRERWGSARIGREREEASWSEADPVQSPAEPKSGGRTGRLVIFFYSIDHQEILKKKKKIRRSLSYSLPHPPALKMMLQLVQLLGVLVCGGQGTSPRLRVNENPRGFGDFVHKLCSGCAVGGGLRRWRRESSC